MARLKAIDVVSKEEYMAQFDDSRPLLNLIFSPQGLLDFLALRGDTAPHHPANADFVLDVSLSFMPKTKYRPVVDETLGGSVVILRVGNSELFTVEVYAQHDQASLKAAKKFLQNVAQDTDRGFLPQTSLKYIQSGETDRDPSKTEIQGREEREAGG